MKKINILTIVIVLLALATPLMADVTLSGEIIYGFTFGPNPAAGDNMTSGEKQSSKIVFTGKPDDNSKATIELDVDELVNDDDAPWIGKALFETKVLASLGLDLPAEVILKGGYFDVGVKDYGKVSGYEIEDVTDAKLAKDWLMGIDVEIMDMVTVRIGIDPDFEYQGTGGGNSDTDNIGYIMGAFGGAGPVSAEIFYTNNNAPADEAGDMMFGVGVELGFGDIGIEVGLGGHMPLMETDDILFRYGVGLGFTYGDLLSAGFGMMGIINDVADSIPVNSMGINVDVKPISLIEIGAGVVLALYDGNASTLDRFDVQAHLEVGALDLELGYSFQPEDATGNAGVNNKEDLYPWNQNSGAGGIFIQAKLKF